VPFERVLSERSPWRLQKLTLDSCGVTTGHAEAIAGSPGVRGLLSLELLRQVRVPPDEDREAVQALTSSPYMRSLVHLNLARTGTGPTGSRALAAAEGWDCLRSLNLDKAGLDTDDVRTLLDSPLVCNLVRLDLGSEGHSGEPGLGVSPGLAAAFADPVRLPHLAQLNLRVHSYDPHAQAILSGSPSLAWIAVHGWCEGALLPRDFHAPERWPPLDSDV
jgi:hypothetical protein